MEEAGDGDPLVGSRVGRAARSGVPAVVGRRGHRGVWSHRAAESVVAGTDDGVFRDGSWVAFGGLVSRRARPDDRRVGVGRGGCGAGEAAVGLGDLPGAGTFGCRTGQGAVRSGRATVGHGGHAGFVAGGSTAGGHRWDHARCRRHHRQRRVLRAARGEQG